jgi:F0F1-type ATP synthase epsilon subunit
MNPLLKVRVITPKSSLFEGEATSVSSINSQGKFDILGQHANFITLIENQEIQIVLIDKQVLKYRFSRAIVYNFQNTVSIYAEPLTI